MNYFSFLPPINLYCPQNDDIALPLGLPPDAHPLNTILCCLSSMAAIYVHGVFCFILFFVAQLAGQIDGTTSNPMLPAQRASSLTSPQPFLPTIS
jgi:hypothetical protein